MVKKQLIINYYILEKDYNLSLYKQIDKHISHVFDEVQQIFLSKKIQLKLNQNRYVRKQFFNNEQQNKIFNNKQDLNLIIGKDLWTILGEKHKSFDYQRLVNYLENNNWNKNYYPLYYNTGASIKSTQQTLYHISQTLIDLKEGIEIFITKQ